MATTMPTVGSKFI